MTSIKWEGFSDEDINSLKCPNPPNPNAELRIHCDNVHTANVKHDLRISPREAEVRQNDKLSPEEYGEIRKGSLVTTSSTVCAGQSLTQDSEYNIKGESLAQSDLSQENMKSLTASLLLSGLSQPSPSVLNLEDFGAQQKLMEEKNRLRKVYLSKALADRKKQTQEEQQRLNMIQEELQKLDQRVSTDVSIIRDQIETASVEFMEAQKRYDRAEKEFLDAKLHLYTKLERKELLTHHLCTIIEQNEMRKAQKLSELMEKLNLVDSTREDCSPPQLMQAANEQEPASNPSHEIILTPAAVENQEAFSKKTCTEASLS